MDKYKEDFQDCLKIKGIVELINGDAKILANNKFVQPMLSWLTNMISVNSVGGVSGSVYRTWGISTYAWNIYLGTNTTTPTAYNTNVLTNPIGTSPGTPATTQTGYTQNPTNGVFNTIFTATWNPGVISGTIGEMGLYLSVRNILQGFGWILTFSTNTDVIETKQMVSRLAAADGSFTPFTINTANPLTINWTVQYSFS